MTGRRTLGDYELEHRLGEGASGTVWRARQVSAHDRPVAVKRVSAVERPLALDHPHIVRVIEVIADGDDGLAIAMELAVGSASERLSRRGPMPADEVAAIVRRLASALAFAHGRGIAHGNVKASNVLFRGDGEPILADFGLGSMAAAAADDLVALGATALELLGGDLAGAPEPLASAVARCLAADPADRFPDAGALVAALGPAGVASTLARTAITPTRPHPKPALARTGSAPTRVCPGRAPTDPHPTPVPMGSATAPTDPHPTPVPMGSATAPSAPHPTHAPMGSAIGPTDPHRTHAPTRDTAPADPHPTPAPMGRATASTEPDPESAPTCAATAAIRLETTPAPASLHGGNTPAEPDGGATRTFGPRPPIAPATTPVRRVGARAAIAVAGAVALLAGVALLVRPATPTARAGATPVRSCPPPAAADVDDLVGDVDGDGCAETVALDKNVLTKDGERYEVGRAGDVVVLGDWDCDGDATPGVFRPPSGEAHLFDAWATQDRPLPAARTVRTKAPPKTDCS